MSKVVIITGASSGIGKALAQVYGEKGHKLILTARRAELLNQTVKQLQSQNIDCRGIVADVTQKADNLKVVEACLKTYGRIDVLINNAGISMRSLFADLNLEVVERIMEVNFFGMVHITQSALPYLIKSKGSIIGISSVAGFRGLPGRTAYSASKFAMNGFLEALRTELLSRDVHVLTVCPGFTQSNIRKVALNRQGKAQAESPRQESKMMSAETCAAKIYKAHYKRRNFVVFTAEGRLLLWLNKFVGGLLDKMLYKKLVIEEGLEPKS